MQPGASSILMWFGLTVAVEGAVLRPFVRRARNGWALDLFLINAFTHPLASISIACLGAAFWPVEGVVCLFEATLWRMLQRRGWRWCTAVSVVTNGVTAAISHAL